MERHQRLPDEASENSSEEDLAKSLRSLLLQQVEGRLPEELWRSLKEVPGVAELFEKLRPYASFTERLGELAAFVESHRRRLPSVNARSREERRLAKFVHNQRVALSSGRLPDDRLKLLLEVPGMAARVRLWKVRAEGTERPRCSWASFSRRLQELRTWSTEHGRLPRRWGLTQSERRLHAFLHEQRTLFMRGVLADVRLRKLEKIPGMNERLQVWAQLHAVDSEVGTQLAVPKRRWGWRSFLALLRELQQWSAEHGWLPRHDGGVTKREPCEKRLAKFIANQCQAHRLGLLSEARLKALAEVPGMSERIQKWVTPVSFEIQVASLEQWIALQEVPRLPSRRSSDPEELRLAVFLDTHHRSLAKSLLSPDRVERLFAVPAIQASRLWLLYAPQRQHPLPAEAAPQDHPSASSSAVPMKQAEEQPEPGLTSGGVAAALKSYMATLRELKDWVVSHGQLPKQSQKADALEKRLARFLLQEQGACVHGALTPDRRQMLLEVPCMAARLAQWEQRWAVQGTSPSDVAAVAEKDYRTWVQELDSWVRVHHRLPVYGKGDAQERRLASFLNSQRRHLLTSAPERWKLDLLKAVPRVPEQFEQWQRPRCPFHQRVEELEAWVAAHDGQLPTGTEKRLFGFIRKQQELFMLDKLPLDRQQRLSQVPGFRERLAKWAAARRKGEVEDTEALPRAKRRRKVS